MHCFKATNGSKISEQLSSLDKLEDQHEILVILGESIHRTDERMLHIIQESVLINNMIYLLHLHYFHLAHVFHRYPFVTHFALCQFHSSERSLA